MASQMRLSRSLMKAFFLTPGGSAFPSASAASALLALGPGAVRPYCLHATAAGRDYSPWYAEAMYAERMNAAAVQQALAVSGGGADRRQEGAASKGRRGWRASFLMSCLRTAEYFIRRYLAALLVPFRMTRMFRWCWPRVTKLTKPGSLPYGMLDAVWRAVVVMDRNALALQRAIRNKNQDQRRIDKSTPPSTATVT